MNILQVHHNWDQAEPGGIVAMMNDLMDGLRDRGHDVTLMISDWQADRPRPQTDRGGRSYYRFNLAPMPGRLTEVKALAGWLLRLPLSLWRLRRFCREHAIDVVQLHYADALYLVFAVLRWLGGPPFLVTVHRGDVMGYPSLSGLHRWGYQRVMAAADMVVAVSQFLADAAQKVSPAARRVVVVHNGYTPLAEPLPGRAELAGRLGIDLPPAYAVMVGNCRPYKGFDIALYAWQQLRADGIDLPLLIVGGGPDLLATQELADTLGLAGDVQFLGPRSRAEAVAVIQDATLLVAPSRNEGQGIVILEAGCYAVPVVCSDIAPFLEMVEDGVTAQVFPVGDICALSACIRRNLEGPERAREMALALQAKVRREFSSATMVDRYLALYEQMTR